MERRYKRYFIILEEEDRGFSISRTKGVKGYAKIEVRENKGVLYLYCQNMKILDEEKEIYELYLISTENIKSPIILSIDQLMAEEDGRLELTYSFDNSNIEGTNKTIDSFDTIALIVKSTRPSYRLISPLVGYIHTENSKWKSILQAEIYPQNKFEHQKSFNIIEEYDDNMEFTDDVEVVDSIEPIHNVEFIESVESLEEADPLEDIETIEDMEVIEDLEVIEDIEILKDMEPRQEAQGFEDIEAEELPLLEENIQPMDEIKTMDFIEEADCGVETDLKDYMEIRRGYTSDQINYEEISILQEYIETTLKEFLEINFDENKFDNYKWWRVPYNSYTIYGSYMPFISHVETLHNPYYYHHPHHYTSRCQSQVYNYQHHIFGIAYDCDNRAEYYIYGLPGKKTTEEQPYKGETGFVYWQPSYLSKDGEDGLGYWLLHIDAKTNGIVEPFTPTEI